jgi:hypothetical protein
MSKIFVEVHPNSGDIRYGVAETKPDKGVPIDPVGLISLCDRRERIRRMPVVKT